MAARMWSRPLFRTAFPGNDVNTTVRRSLSALDMENPALKKLCEASEAIGVKYESPIYFSDCYAHFGAPSKKVAIFMRQSLDTAQFSRIRGMWEGSKYAKGWNLLFTTTRQIEQSRIEDLQKNLESMMGGKR